MSTYIDNAVGASSSTGLDPYLISGSVDQYGPMIGVLTNGASYCYRAVYVDPTVGSDYETGVGVWNSGTNTLSRATVKTSSNSNAAVNWGAGDKVIYIVEDSELQTDMEQMVNGTTKFYLTDTQASNIAASKTKTDLLTVTVPANLDTMQSDIAAFSGGMTYRGNWDASTGVFPGAGVGSNGDYWYCSVSGVVDTVSFDAGDSIVALVNNPSISTFAGNWSRHDSLDAVQSVAGLTGTITVDELNEALGLPLFPGTQDGEPVLFVGTGQSNWVGIYAVDIGDMASNPSIQDWQWTRQSGAATSFSFAVANPVRTVLNASGGTYNVSALTIGMRGSSEAITPSGPAPGQPTGHILWSCCNELTSRYRNDFFMVNIAKNGEAISGWASAAEMEAALADHIPDAIAEINGMGYPVAITAPRRVFWLQGESNIAGGTTPADYASAWLTFKALAETKWAIEGFTQWVICDIGDGYYSSQGAWPAFARIIEGSSDDVQIVSALNLAEDPTVTYHFTGPALNAYGVRASFVCDTPGTGRTFRTNEVSDLLWEWGPAVSTVPNGASAVAFSFDTDVAYSTAGAVHTEWLNNGAVIASIDKDGNAYLEGGIISVDPTPASPFTVRVDGSASFDLVYQYDDAFLDATIMTSGGPNGALYRSRMTAGVGAAAHSFSTSNTLSGTDKIAAFSHNGLLNAVTISRLGLITAASGGGFSTTGSTTTGTLTATTSTTTGALTATGATVLSYSTVTVPTATVVAVSTPSVYLNGQLTHNFANSYPGYRVDVAETHISQQATSFVAGAVFAARSTFKNQSGFAGTFAGTVGFLAADTFQSDTVNANIGFGGDFSASPTFGITGGATTLAVTLYNHYASTATLGSGVTITSRGGYQIGDKAGGGTVTSQAALVSNITSSGATNTTHVLMGTSTIPTGNFGVYQSDTFPNRFNGPICAPWLGQSGATPLVAVKGTRTYVFANGSTSTITLPTLTSMTTGHTAAQLSGYELVIINDRTTDVVSGTDFLLGAGTSFGFGSTLTITARHSRTFVWNGVDTWL